MYTISITESIHHQQCMAINLFSPKRMVLIIWTCRVDEERSGGHWTTERTQAKQGTELYRDQNSASKGFQIQCLIWWLCLAKRIPKSPKGIPTSLAPEGKSINHLYLRVKGKGKTCRIKAFHGWPCIASL